MTIKEIAKRLVELCRQGQFESAQKELYANDAISIEAYETPAFTKETKGLKAILEKGAKWTDMVEEMFSLDVTEPIIADNSFAVAMTMDVKTKGMDRMKMSELCVYQVKDGKIISEQFYV